MPEPEPHFAHALLLCPVNISEGRRSEVVAAIAARGEQAGAALLDVHSDPDHHRSVLSFAGMPAELVAGLVAVARAAFEVLDLRRHEGVHPRLGTVDVVPFVPVRAAGMPAAVAAADTFAREVWSRWRVPSFFYDLASAGVSLPAVRREAWRGRSPDIGGPDPHPSAGAMAVGARGGLVAFNVDLATADTAVAQRIARRIRERDGGLPGVRALGLGLHSRGVAQVSMNLTDPAATPVGAAFEAVCALASAEGVEVTASEVVGLAPRTAVPEDTQALRLRRPVRILEEELARRGFSLYD